MESPQQSLVKGKWMFCTIASFLGIFFLVVCLNQSPLQGAVFASLRDWGNPASGKLSSTESLIPQAGTSANESPQRNSRSNDPPSQSQGSAASAKLAATESLNPQEDTSVNASSLRYSGRKSPPASQYKEADMIIPQSVTEMNRQPKVEEKVLPGLNMEISPKASPEGVSPEAGIENKVFPTNRIEEKVSADSSMDLSPKSSIKELAAQSDTGSPIQLVPNKELPPQINAEPNKHSSPTGTSSTLEANDKMSKEKCNLFEGRWVYDKAYPLYKAPRCPFLSNQVSCQKNGRPDSNYEHWRWEPNGCQIPRFNGTHMLEILRGKRVVLAGDSINRNQWESLACLLYSSISPSRAFVDARSSEHKIFKALDYNCIVEFYWSPFLVRMGKTEGGKRVLQLDKLSEFSRQWQGADVMVFNTGHWWTHHGKMRSWDLFERKGELVEEMEGDTAFETGLKTWAKWVDRQVDVSKTKVFFRSISPEHKRENLHWCYNQTHPITNETYIRWFPKSMIEIVERTVHEMKTPVEYLNITRLSEYRREAHTAIYTVRQGKLLTTEQRNQPELYSDCSHWCLPGLPDTWNILIYASIIDNSIIL